MGHITSQKREWPRDVTTHSQLVIQFGHDSRWIRNGQVVQLGVNHIEAVVSMFLESNLIFLSLVLIAQPLPVVLLMLVVVVDTISLVIMWGHGKGESDWPAQMQTDWTLSQTGRF